MTQKPLVSAIIIFLNGEQFIEEAIASIFAQSYDNWELLLVDDGSVDGSTLIARKYARKYPKKIFYLEHEGHQNKGMSASRNLGISHAKGEYIGFLDADDIWLPEKLEEQAALLTFYKEAAMVYGRTQIWYSWTGRPEDSQRDHFYDLGVQENTLVNPPKLLLLLMQNKCQTPTTCNALIRREVFDHIGRFEDVFRTMYEDQVFFSKVLLQKPVFVSGQCWAKYRQHAQNRSEQSKTQKYYLIRRPFLNWLGNYLSRNKVTDKSIWQVFQREMWQCRHPFLCSLLKRVKYRLNAICKG
ncbi:MAG: glycosyltransferase family 2 protein [Candidatus Loosdrechtia sp.]|uniref:glycosyltransferase family 2 protein n=1 Tax=Candidatus Loosdrechtia sp. TaxID=3101272 RepID=UPI003A65A51B|nr:MAG: glycosyltransferase family A protein [Candidatus Jettenia sp. AMX2]